MPTFVKTAGVWKKAKEIFVKQAGVWKKTTTASVKIAGVWTPVFKNVVSINVTIGANATNFNLYTFAGSPASPVVVNCTINPGIWVSSNSSGIFAFIVGAFKAGSIVNIVNNGFIAGMGGAGGGGTGVDGFLQQAGGAPGGNGGPGLDARRFGIGFTINVANNGWIGGGGGGGGGGAAAAFGESFAGDSAGGGGGGGGVCGSPFQSGGGTGGIAQFGTAFSPGTAGGSGNSVSPGGAGSAGAVGSSAGGAGGAGGNKGVAGGSGLAIVSGQYSFGPFAGGAAGYAVYGYSEIVWSPLGTLYGPTTG